jgi:hypothetical protein
LICRAVYATSPPCRPLAITSPAGRPIQTSRDLPSFWADSWREVAKEMRGRYPKHPGRTTPPRLCRRSAPNGRKAALDLSGGLRHVAAMSTARIIENSRKTTSSGRAKTGGWSLEFESSRPQRHDPLTGWVGNADPSTQVRLSFESKEHAVAYCEKHGLDYHVVPAAPVALKIQAYADNFR